MPNLHLHGCSSLFHLEIWSIGVNDPKSHSELPAESPEFSRSRVSAVAWFINSGMRRRLALMNQLLIYTRESAYGDCSEQDVKGISSYLSHGQAGAPAEHLLLVFSRVGVSQMV